MESKMKQPCVYIVTNKNRTNLYIGVTSNLIQRIYQHKNHLTKGFTDRYNCEYLVYYETHEMMDSAITREKQLKKWKQEWKLKLIEEKNPNWWDLYNEITGLKDLKNLEQFLGSRIQSANQGNFSSETTAKNVFLRQSKVKND
jgi:putative endonuclease